MRLLIAALIMLQSVSFEHSYKTAILHAWSIQNNWIRFFTHLLIHFQIIDCSQQSQKGAIFSQMELIFRLWVSAKTHKAEMFVIDYNE